MTKRTIQKRLISLAICLVLIGFSYILQSFEQTKITPPGMYLVTKVVDGDTIEIDMSGNKEKVRLIGVDTPETHHPNKGVQCFGILASEFTKNALEGKVVRIEADETNQNRDRYQRLLRYVYTEQNELWNATLVREGYAHALAAFPFTKMDEFIKLEGLAKDQDKGLWSACP